ncbi:MAG TPA: hypothetical protein VK806_11450 [Bacteroidia bacterium]|jgi:hypothetical protein|nr:hypothetical protein [Bacteroidia bacterium]
MRKYLILLAFVAAAFISKAQTDTATQLQNAKNLWATYNNGDPNDTSQFAALSADYITVLNIDTANARANQGLGDVYSFFSSYWLTQAQAIQSSNPTLYNSCMQQSNNYSALAAPYLQRYLRIKGISN